MALVCLFLLFVVSMGCESYFKEDTFHKEPAFANLMCTPDLVDFQTKTNSAVSCVRTCAEKPGCRSLIYLSGNKTCYGIKSSNPFGTSSSLPGATFYKANSSQTTTTSTSTTSTTTMSMTTTTTPSSTTTIGPGTPMIEGLQDSQFTASSVYPHKSWCDPWHVKFSNGDSWCAATPLDANQWLQVDFSQQVLVTHVITKGFATYDDYVSSYRVLTSTDCSNFAAVTDGQGDDKVFQGNTDAAIEAPNALEPPLVLRCLRINPITWVGHIDLKLEVLGHQI